MSSRCRDRARRSCSSCRSTGTPEPQAPAAARSFSRAGIVVRRGRRRRARGRGAPALRRGRPDALGRRLAEVGAGEAEPPARPARVLVVDDEPQILRALKVVLRDAGFEAVAAENAARGAGHRVAATAPGGDRRPRAPRRRRRGADAPAAGVERDADPRAVGGRRGGGEGAGAGGRAPTTTSPSRSARGSWWRACRPRCGAARPAEDEPKVVVDGLEIDLAARARRAATPSRFTSPRSSSTCCGLLVRNRGRLLTHRALLTEVWGPGYEDDIQPLRTHIARLRAKIEPRGRLRAAADRHRAGRGLPLRRLIVRRAPPVGADVAPGRRLPLRRLTVTKSLCARAVIVMRP